MLPRRSGKHASATTTNSRRPQREPVVVADMVEAGDVVVVRVLGASVSDARGALRQMRDGDPNGVRPFVVVVTKGASETGAMTAEPVDRLVNDRLADADVRQIMAGARRSR